MPFVPRAPAFPTPRAATDVVTVTWVGHATFLLQIGGVNVLTDPMWSERASPVQYAGPRRFALPGVPLDALPPIDLVLQSHNHYDHLDEDTVRLLTRRDPGAVWLAPLGVAPQLRDWGVEQAHELDWWNSARFGALRLTSTPAQHFSGRGFADRDRTLWCGWALRAGSRAVWFAGDTGLHPEFATIGERAGPFDVALMPVGAYEPRWFMRPVHMNPEDAVQAFQALRVANAMVPMHWGTFKLTDEPMAEPPVRTVAAWRAAGLPDDALWVLVPGETKVVTPVLPD